MDPRVQTPFLALADGIPEGNTRWSDPLAEGPLPRWHVPQRAERDEGVREAMKGKLDKVRRLKYIGPGRVDSLTSFFSVPKGKSDTWMVYNGTKILAN
jgi:hypothetical protein